MEDHEHERLARLANLLFDAARRGDARLLGEAMAGGAPADLANQHGDSLLMLATYHGHTDAARVLLDAGATVDLPNDRGQTPLGGVVFKGYTELAGLLLERGADPRAGTPAAVGMALMFQRDDILALIEAGDAGRDATRPEDGPAGTARPEDGNGDSSSASGG